jgi:hypothetical protein
MSREAAGETRSASGPQATSATATQLFPAVDTFLGRLRLDVAPREGVRVAVGGLREKPIDTLDPRKPLIERMTASTEFPVEEALARVQVGDHPFLTAGTVAAGETVHGYC